MPSTWTTPSTGDVTAQFSPQEIATFTATQGAANLAAVLAKVVDEIQGAILGGGYCTQADLTANSGKLPPDLHNDAIAMARWNLLISLPALKQLQTEERKLAAERATAKLAKISSAQCSVRPPTAPTTSRTGNWGSENKIIPRTHPTPRPASQFPPNADDYANPDQPADEAAT